MTTMSKQQVINVLWSWLRVFLVATLSAGLTALASGNSLDWRAFLIAGVLAVGPVIVRWLDETDTKYGRGSVA